MTRILSSRSQSGRVVRSDPSETHVPSASPRSIARSEVPPSYPDIGLNFVPSRELTNSALVVGEDCAPVDAIVTVLAFASASDLAGERYHTEQAVMLDVKLPIQWNFRRS